MAQTLVPDKHLGGKRRKAEPIATAEPSQVTEGGGADHRTVVGRTRSAATRVRIMSAAARVYSVKGIDAPVIDDFLQAAGISRGTFYNHFTTTAQLLAETVNWLREDMNKWIVHFIAGMDNPVRQSATAMRLYLRWATATPTLAACVATLPEISASAWVQARKELAQGIAMGEFVVPSIDVACDLAFGTLREAIRRAAREPEKPFEHDAVVAVILTGMGVSAPRLRQVMALPLPPLPLTPVDDEIPAMTR